MTVVIERLGHLGDGIAQGPVFVPRVLPGEVVEGEVVGNRLDAPRIVTPSPHRVAPPCRHYKSCGGCALQHASDAFVSEWKRGVVVAALAAHGLEAPVRAIHVSPPKSRRRATFSGRRTKSGALVGFHAPGSDVIRSVPECLVLHPALVAALPELESITRAGASRSGEIKLAVTITDTGLDVAVSGGKPLDIALRTSLAAIAEKADLARLTWAGETVAQRRPPVLSIGTAPVPIPPAAFLQATADGEAALAESVSEAIGPAQSVADLFAGCGTFALRLAALARVHAVEGDADLLAALDAGWRHGTGLKRVTTERRDLFRQPLAAEDLVDFDAVVIDPPRAGAEAQTRELAASGVRRVAAVSCNPVTFARDAAMLVAGGYRMAWVDVVDQFRWSPHVELVACFVLD